MESPRQFIFKLLICAICMNCAYFFLEQIINMFYYFSIAIKDVGGNLLQKSIGFSDLINNVNTTLFLSSNSINIFSIDGLIKGAITFSLLYLVLSYAYRFIIIKVFALLTPFAILSLSLKNTSWFFKAWAKNLFSLLFLQIIVSLVLVILFSMDFSNGNLLSKFVYIGGIYVLIKANSFVKEFIGGISTNIK